MVFEKFRHAVQQPQQSVEDWILFLKQRAAEIKRYQPEVLFSRFAEQILVGTKNSSFIVKFRQVFRPLNMLLRPTVTSYAEFETWLDAWKKEQREIARQRERQKMLTNSQPRKDVSGKDRVKPGNSKPRVNRRADFSKDRRLK